MPEFEARVGVTDMTPEQPLQEVAVDFGQPVQLLTLPPDYAVHLAQLLVKNARIAGYAGPFVELATGPATTLN